MKKVYSIFVGLLLVVLLTLGCISLVDRDVKFSEIQQRDTKSFPRGTVSGLFNGSFFGELTEYYGDTFPGREGMVEEGGFYDFFFGFTGQIEEPEETQPRT